MMRTALMSLAVVALNAMAACWLTAGFEVWTAEGARRLDVAHTPVSAPAATLLGAEMTGQELRSVLARPGQVTLVSFIYTRCPSLCVALGSSMQRVQASFLAPQSRSGGVGHQGVIQLLSISFDPDFDDADQLKRYAALWQADPQHWRLVTVPNPAQLQRLLRAWQVRVIDDKQGGYEHNAALLVIDDHARLVRIFDDNDAAGALAFASRLLGHVEDSAPL
jgi:protein SCO1